MKKLLLLFITCLCVIVVLSGCAKVVSEETETVQATVTECKYYPDGVVYVNDTYIWYDEEYITVVEYNGKSYRFYNCQLYRKYKDSVGCTVNATYKTVTYDNGKVKSKITGIE